MPLRGVQTTVGLGWLAFLFFTLAYVPLYLLLAGPSSVGVAVGLPRWPLPAWGGYALLFLVLWVVAWFTAASRRSGSEASVGPLEPARWSRRTGLGGVDRLGFFACLVATLLAWSSDFWQPWLAVLTALFGVSAFALGDVPWPVDQGRDIPSPESDSSGEDGGDILKREWTWGCLCRPLKGEVRLRIRKAAADGRARQNPSHRGLSTGELESAVTELVASGATDREPREAARQLLAFARNLRFNYFEEAQNTLQFVQTIPYAKDDATKGKEYFRYAIETLHDNVGDCDCKAVLASTLFRLMGLRSVVLLSAEESHAAVAVEGAPDFPGSAYFKWKGSNYYFCETTDGSFGFTVGEVPPGVNLDRYTMRVEIGPGLHTA